jgi:hypothetical protein
MLDIGTENSVTSDFRVYFLLCYRDYAFVCENFYMCLGATELTTNIMLLRKGR